jgi:hypothetical protein
MDERQGAAPLGNVAIVISLLITMVVHAAWLRAFGSGESVHGAPLGLILRAGIAGTDTQVGEMRGGRSRTVG